MTETIEQKALALVNAVRIERGFPPSDSIEFDNSHWDTAFYRAIEAHEADNARHAAEMEAFKREVSEAVQDYIDHYRQEGWLGFDHFIIPQPDPLVEALQGVSWYDTEITAKELRAAIEKRGGKIVWGEG